MWARRGTSASPSRAMIQRGTARAWQRMALAVQRCCDAAEGIMSCEEASERTGVGGGRDEPRPKKLAGGYKNLVGWGGGGMVEPPKSILG